MASQINNIYVNIDAEFPRAGVDNDTQGFRDNFDIIKSSLAVAGGEITTLQDETAKINAGNNFSGNTITNADLVGVTDKSLSYGVVSQALANIAYRNGSHQRVVVNADNASLVINWGITEATDLAADRYARLVVEVSSLEGNAEHIVDWACEGGGEVKYDNKFPADFKAINTPQLIEFSTYDAGGTMYARYLGKYDTSVVTTTDTFTNITVGVSTTTNALNVTGPASLEGAAVLDSTLTVAGTSSLNGNLIVAGSTTLESAVVQGNLRVEGNVTILGSNFTTVAQLDDVQDVTLNSVRPGEIIKYSLTAGGATAGWTNDFDLVEYDVTCEDNGSGSQIVFNLNGQALVDSNGAKFDLEFKMGKKYRFKLDDASNASKTLRFSTTPDTSVPATITNYTDNVYTAGVAGVAGGYTEILITEDTPAVLYLYADEPVGVDTSGYGAEYPIRVGRQSAFTGSESISTGIVSATKSVTTFSAGTTTTVNDGYEGQIKTLIVAAGSVTMAASVPSAGWKASGSGTVTLSSRGAACTLQFIQGKWYCIGNNGGVFA
jgi:hypothetical protein